MQGQTYCATVRITFRYLGLWVSCEFQNRQQLKPQPTLRRSVFGTVQNCSAVLTQPSGLERLQKWAYDHSLVLWCLNLFCIVWGVDGWVSFVMCGCFGNVCLYILCFVLFSLCVFILICFVCTGGKGGRCVWLTTLPISCTDCLEIWEPQPPGTLRVCPWL
jgi:hypothetical protein